MQSGYISSGTQRLHYLRWGAGKRLLLAFHGYGNNASLFTPLAAHIPEGFTLISFDLPYHGKSEWHDDEPWSVDALVTVVRSLMQQHDTNKVSLAGYSIGGRICLTLIQAMPEAIDQVMLLAPDGLVPNAFYRLATNHFLGKRLFHHFLDKPEGYLRMVSWLEKRRWINAAHKKLVEQHAALPASRAFLKKVWPNLRLFIPDQQLVKQQIRKHHIPVQLFMGRHDRVIPLKHAELFASGAADIHMHILDKGHRVIDNESAATIVKSLYDS